MVYLAFESLKTLPIGEMSFGCEAKGGNQVPAVCSAAILRLDSPFHGLVVELCINNSTVEGDIFPNVQLFVDVVKILPKFFPAWVLLGPVPVLMILVSMVSKRHERIR